MNRRTFLKSMLGAFAFLTLPKFNFFKTKNAFANDAVKIKKLGFGFMRLPQLDQTDPTKIDIEQVKKMVDKFLEEGFTYFDTAWMYMGSKSEETLRETLVKRHKRETFQVATKLPMMYLKSKDDQEEIFNKQLKNCGIDYFDYYLLHNLNVSNYDTAKAYESFKFIAKKKKEGKIKHIGFSFHDTADLLETILKENPEPEFVQIQLNYLDMDNPSIQSRKCLEVCKKYGKQVIVMEPVKGGTLVNLPKEADELLKKEYPNMSSASLAIRYAASFPEVLVVLSGMSNMEQLLDNTSYMKNFKPLSEKEQGLVKSVVEIINKGNSIPCTACQYCVADCPRKILIPNLFALYNADKRAEAKGFSIQKFYYNNLTKDSGKASSCIKCKKCEKLCPQHIKISEKLVDVAKHFEG